MNLICVSSRTIGWIGSTYFVGWALGSPVIPILSDKWGRRWIVVISALGSVICYAGLQFSQSVYVTIALNFAGGIITAGRSSICFVYMCEFVPSNLQNYLTIFFCALDGTQQTAMTIYFQFISRRWFWISAVGFFYNLVALIGIAFFLPESPIYLQRQTKFSGRRLFLSKF